MKNLKVGNASFLSLGLVEGSEIKDCSIWCMHSGPDFILKNNFPHLFQCLVRATLKSCNYEWDKRIYAEKANLKYFIILKNIKKPYFTLTFYFSSILILYFAIRKCVYFFILKIKFHLYFKNMGNMYSKPIMMKDASLFFSLFPSSLWP